MYKNQHISVVIPALNEALAIGKVICELRDQLSPDHDVLIDDIVVCDNGSTDATPEIARDLGARVVCQTQKGYGIACLTALAALKKTDIVLFVDADDSNRASQAIDLIQELVDSNVDLVIGSRTLGQAEPGAQTVPQLFGNWLTAKLVKLIWQYEISDLGPYRAIRYPALEQLEMQDESFGWTIEMQVKAIQQGLLMTEIPVDSTRRIGESKISGTFWGVIGAGKGILGKIAVLWWQGRKKLHPLKLTNNTPTLVIFCKRPKLHQGKQRLVEGISADSALQIAQALLACAIEDAKSWQGAVVIACSDSDDVPWAHSLMPNALVITQLPEGESGNLGQRLNYVDQQLRAQGHQQLVFIGTDAPVLNNIHYQAVISSLTNHDIALSQADDGGVVIMANRNPWPDLLNLPWSTDQLSLALSQLCQQQKLTVDYTVPGYDIDYVDDIKKLSVDLKTDVRPARKLLLNKIETLVLSSGETA